MFPEKRKSGWKVKRKGNISWSSEIPLDRTWPSELELVIYHLRGSISIFQHQIYNSHVAYLHFTLWNVKCPHVYSLLLIFTVTMKGVRQALLYTYSKWEKTNFRIMKWLLKSPSYYVSWVKIFFLFSVKCFLYYL